MSHLYVTYFKDDRISEVFPHINYRTLEEAQHYLLDFIKKLYLGFEDNIKEQKMAKNTPMFMCFISSIISFIFKRLTSSLIKNK